MNTKYSNCIVLKRVNYAEYDRIITFLSEKYGKITAIAKGSRKEKSKLAGGIELFSVSNIGFVHGKGEIDTVVSTRLQKHYDRFLSDMERVEFAYESLKTINRITEKQHVDDRYFRLMDDLFACLDNKDIPTVVTKVWWYCQLTKLTGHCINITKTIDGQNFNENSQYIFEPERGGFLMQVGGPIEPSHIKFIKVSLANQPSILAKIKGADKFASLLDPLMRAFSEYVY
jgi:DNA repair protein RecO (recombination protein O)